MRRFTATYTSTANLYNDRTLGGMFMYKKLLWFNMSLVIGILLTASTGYTAEGHRTQTVTVTRITGDTLFYKTEEGTTRNIALKIVEKYEQVENVKVGDKLSIEFDEGNQVIRINRPDRLTVSGQLMKFDSTDRKVTVKLNDGTTKTYTVIPPVVSKLSVVPEGTNIVLDIDMKNNFVKDFDRK
jgi:hypothetical protein